MESSGKGAVKAEDLMPETKQAQRTQETVNRPTQPSSSRKRKSTEKPDVTTQGPKDAVSTDDTQSCVQNLVDSSETKDTLLGATERFTFFYKSASPFSQWYPCQFSADGVEYNCAEQYMMYQKAVLFKDQKMAESILAAVSPRKQKSLGRKVSNFDVNIWKVKCRQLVADGNYLKFTQNEELLAQLMGTSGTTLVEASPRDKIWGIGLGANNPLALNRATWRGTNYLGEALTQVRERVNEERLTSAT